MQVIDLLRREGPLPLRNLVLCALVGGFGCAALLAVVCSGAKASVEEGPDFGLLVFFVATLLLYLMAQRYVLRLATAEVETAVQRVRTRLVGKARRCEILSLEAVGRSRLYTAVASDADGIAASVRDLLVGALSAIAIVCIFVYIASLSIVAFFFALAAGAFSLFLYVHQIRRTNALKRRALVAEEKLRASLSALLDGFKEVKLSSARSDAVEADFAAASAEAAAAHTAAGSGLGDTYLLAQLLLFGMLGVLTFILPGLDEVAPEVLAQLVVLMLFIAGPAASVCAAIPKFLTAEASAERLKAVEDELDGQLAAEPGIVEDADGAVSPPRPWPAFKQLATEQLYYRHRANESFAVGPLTLSIAAGEVVFVTGNAGSGKSTLLKLLAGLYFPDAGSVTVDGRPLRRQDMQAWREQVSGVFSDYHLFSRPHGATVSPDLAAELLTDMELNDATALTDGGFEPLPSASPQRKRLALVSAILEGRPLLLLDEWAADQEPRFRQKFYEEILPALKRRGITVIATTDDDRWFHVADRRIRLEEGKMMMTEGASNG
jgi:putative pyoverdin transport system ATP-binding/permease protein